jgi:hypothetical protein
MNYNDMKLTELKAELKSRNEKVTGNKTELIERLEENDREQKEPNVEKKQKQVAKKTIKVQKDPKIEKPEKEDSRTALEKRLDRVIEKDRKAAQKERDSMDKSLLELLFKTMTGSWYTVHIKDDATLRELREEVAKQIHTDRFRLYKITNQDDQLIVMGDLVFPDGTVHHMLSEEDDEKQLNDLDIINKTMFSITIRFR